MAPFLLGLPASVEPNARLEPSAKRAVEDEAALQALMKDAQGGEKSEGETSVRLIRQGSLSYQGYVVRVGGVVSW